MRILIETIDHADQRYSTTGDWQIFVPDNAPLHTLPPSVRRLLGHTGADYAEPILYITVSKMRDWRHEVLVGLHEGIEAVLCYEAEIDEHNVTEFDRRFEGLRKDSAQREQIRKVGEGLDSLKLMARDLDVNHDAEPGDCVAAPYYKQHQIAAGVERILAAELHVSWSAYERENLDLYESQTTNDS